MAARAGSPLMAASTVQPSRSGIMMSSVTAAGRSPAARRALRGFPGAGDGGLGDDPTQQWIARHEADVDNLRGVRDARLPPPRRSEERRVGKECRSRWSPY